jgi:hypothetical protein
VSQDDVKKTKHGWIFGYDPKIVLPLRVWGEAGIVKLASNMKSKLGMRGEPGMFVGYAIDSLPDTYRMYLPERNSIHETRDVQWSKKLYYELDKAASVHAEDSVIITLNRQNVPLRTVVPAAAINPVPVAPAAAVPKEPVKFHNQVDYISQGFDMSESDEDDDVQMLAPIIAPEPWKRTPSVIEISRDSGDDFSTISSSIGKRKMEVEMIGQSERQSVYHADDDVEMETAA